MIICLIILIKLYENKNLPKVNLVSGEKGNGKVHIIFSFDNLYIF